MLYSLPKDYIFILFSFLLYLYRFLWENIFSQIRNFYLEYTKTKFLFVFVKFSS